MSKKKVLKNTLLYSISSIGIRASSIIFFPIFSFYLAKEDYGILSVTQQMFNYFSLFGSLKLTEALTRFIYDKNQDPKYIPKLIGSIFSVLLPLNLLILLLLFAGGHHLLSPLLNEVTFYPYLAIMLSALPFAILFELMKAYYRAKQAGTVVFKLNIGYFVLNVGMNLFFVAILQIGVMGIILGNLIANFIFFIYAFFAFYRHYPFKINYSLFKPLLKYAMPLIPFAILGSLFSSFEIIIINSTIGAGSTGIYYIAITFASIFGVFKETLRNAITPWFFEQYRHQEKHAEIKEAMRFICWGMALLCLVIALFGRELLIVLSSDPELVIAWKYIPAVCIFFYIVFISQQYNLISYYHKSKVKLMPYANALGLIVLLITGYTLIPLYELWGAVASKLIAVVFMAGYFIRLHFRESQQVFNLFEFILITVLLIFASALAFLPFGLMENFLIKFLIFLGITGAYIYITNRRYNIYSLIIKKLMKNNEK